VKSVKEFEADSKYFLFKKILEKHT